MSSLRRALIALAALAFLLGVGMLVLILDSTHTHAPGVFAARGVFAAYTLVIGWGFAGTGLYAWARRPGNNVGPLMTAVGFAWLLQGLAISGDSARFRGGHARQTPHLRPLGPPPARLSLGPPRDSGPAMGWRRSSTST